MMFYFPWKKKKIKANKQSKQKNLHQMTFSEEQLWELPEWEEGRGQVPSYYSLVFQNLICS